MNAEKGNSGLRKIHFLINYCGEVTGARTLLMLVKLYLEERDGSRK